MEPSSAAWAVASWIDTTEIANPKEFWIASAEPTSSRGHAAADSAENCGESATTEIPQTTSSPTARTAGQRSVTG